MNKTLSELAIISYGADYKKNQQGDNVPIYGTGGLMGFTSVALNEGPAVLSGRKGSINNPIYIEGRFWNVDTIFCIKPQGGVHAKWLFYNFQNTNLERLNEATGVPSVSASALKKLLFKYVDLPIQRKIARILSTVDGQIEKTEAIIAKYQAMKQGMLQDLFTRGINPETGQLRPHPADAPDRYKPSPLGLIPKEWEATTIWKSCLIQNQFRKPISAEVRETMQGKYPYYGPTGIQDYINEYRVDGKYVLIGEDGDHFLKWSKQDMTILIVGKCNVNNHAHILEGTENCITEWIHAYFSNRDITFYLTRQGAGRFKLNKATLKSIIFPLPAVEEQVLIVDQFNSINRQIKNNKQTLAKLRLLKQGLMQDLLSGRVAVEPDGV